LGIAGADAGELTTWLLAEPEASMAPRPSRASIEARPISHAPLPSTTHQAAGARAVAFGAASFIAILGANRFGHLPALPALIAALSVIFGTLFVSLRTKWLDPNLSRHVVRLGMPVILAMVSQTAVNIVDTMLIGRLPTEVALPGVAAIGISLPIFWLVGGFLSAIAIGTQAITARRFGQKSHTEAGKTLMTAAPLATAAGIAFSIGAYLLLPAVLPFFNPDPHVV
jgi:hypothetical protein